MTQPEALRLADALDAHQFDEPHAAAAELRRLHAELERCKAVCSATSESWRADAESWNAQRDSLLEALKKAEENGCATVYFNEYDECGAKGCCGVVSYAPHADDCWVTTARAAIKIAASAGKKTLPAPSRPRMGSRREHDIRTL